MTIENYFERRIRPIVEDNNKPSGSSTSGYNNNNSTSGYSSNNSTSGYSSNSSTSGHTSYIGSNTLNSYSNAPYNSGSRSSPPGIIDEDQLTRTFQEIVNYINLDDDDSEHEELRVVKTPQPSSMFSNGGNFSRSALNQHHVHHSLLPEFNSIFGGSKSSSTFNVAVGSKGETAGSKSATLGKSFLDDDWFPGSGHSGNIASSVVSSTHSIVSSIPSIPPHNAVPSLPASTQPIRSAPSHAAGSSRPITPASTIISSSPTTRSNDFYHTFGSSNNSNPPPGDYVCKLCNCDGHWMKDCRLYEPRTPAASISSFKSTSSTGSGSSMSSSNGSNNATRTLLPPGNYVCRLCNVAGHWIDQCSKFQPKHLDIGVGSGNNIGNSGNSGNMSTITSITSSHSHSHSHSNSHSHSLPVMLGPGPTPNYRPPAYLSKPVPSNYICNLCSRPGHWIQQCTEFTPIINHKPTNSKYNGQGI